MTPLGRWAGILLVAMLPFFTSGCGAGIAGLILLLTGSSSSGGSGDLPPVVSSLGTSFVESPDRVLVEFKLTNEDKGRLGARVGFVKTKEGSPAAATLLPGSEPLEEIQVERPIQVLWDAGKDLEGRCYQVQVQVTPIEDGIEGKPVTTNSFRAGNTEPEIRDLLLASTGSKVVASFMIDDPESDAVDLLGVDLALLGKGGREVPPESSAPPTYLPLPSAMFEKLPKKFTSASGGAPGSLVFELMDLVMPEAVEELREAAAALGNPERFFTAHGTITSSTICRFRDAKKESPGDHHMKGGTLILPCSGFLLVASCGARLPAGRMKHTGYNARPQTPSRGEPMLHKPLRHALAVCSIFAALFRPLTGGEAHPPPTAPAAPLATGAPAAPVPSPRIAMLWSSLRGDRSLEAIARHDLALLGTGSLGLEFDRRPAGLAQGFTPESMETARKKIAAIRRLKPGIVLLGEIYFFEWSDSWLPEDHPWWLRKNGIREQFWPGTHRMDCYSPEYRGRVAGWTASLQSSGVDGVFFDNLREEPGPWVELLKEVRRRVGDRFLILANTGYAVGKHDFAAPFLNGFMYESGWSHGRTQWDDTISAMRRSEELLREPRISLIERFEDTGSRAGWPADPKRGQKPPADPAARRWSLCYALIIGEFYYLFSDSTSHHHDWYPEYDVKIGRPAGPGERLGPHTWRRRYDKALVEVNLPGAKEATRIVLETEATDVITGEKGKVFDIPAGDGRIILLR